LLQNKNTFDLNNYCLIFQFLKIFKKEFDCKLEEVLIKISARTLGFAANTI